MDKTKVEIAIESILAELAAAEKKHPNWPADKIHAVGIMIEEAGEAMQAAIDCTYADGDKKGIGPNRRNVFTRAYELVSFSMI